MINGVTNFVLQAFTNLTSVAETFGLQGPEAYAYTSLSNCFEVQDIDDVKEYADTIVRFSFISVCS